MSGYGMRGDGSDELAPDPRSRGDGWSWNWDAPKQTKNTPGSRGPGLSVTGVGSVVPDAETRGADGGRRSVGGSQRGQLRLGPAGPARTSRDGPTTGNSRHSTGDGYGTYSRVGGASPGSAGGHGGDPGYVPSYGLGADMNLGGMNLDDSDDAYEQLDDEDLDSPEQHQTHDVIITEIEEINLTDYMQTLRAPTFSEEALATADFGFGGDRVGSQMNGSYIDTASSPKPSGSAGRAGGAMGDKVPVRTETPGRAGRRVWSRGGNRSSGGGMNAVETPGIDRPQTGGLDEADVNRPSHGLDDDEDGGDSEVDADIFDDSDDDSGGEETHAVDTFGGGQTSGGVLSDDEDGGHAASPKAMGAINPSFGVSSMATKSPSTAAQFSGFVSGGGKSLPGRQSPHPGSSFAASREARRRREEEGDFVVMSTPSGLRRVPSARRRPGSGASGAGSGGGARAGGGTGGWQSGDRFKDGSKGEVVADVYGAKENASMPPRGSSAGGMGTYLQRPPSRQRPPPEATNLFARRAAAAAAAAAAPVVPGLNKVSRPAGMASNMMFSHRPGQAGGW